MSVTETRVGHPILILVALLSLCPLPTVNADVATPGAMPARMTLGSSAIDVMADGSYNPVMDGAPSSGEGSSFWTFMIDGAPSDTRGTGLDARRVMPLSGDTEGLRTVYAMTGTGAVMFDVHYFYDRGAVAIEVVVSNKGSFGHTVGLGYTLRAVDREIWVNQWTEERTAVRYDSPYFDRIAIGRAPQVLGPVLFSRDHGGTAPVAVIIEDHASLSPVIEWGRIPETGKELGTDIAVSIEWQEVELAPGGAVSFIHHFGIPIRSGRPSRSDLSVESVDPHPMITYTGRQRYLTATVRNYDGEDVRALVTLFILERGGVAGHSYTEIVTVPSGGKVTVSDEYTVWSTIERTLWATVVPVTSSCMRIDDCMQGLDISSLPLPYGVHVTAAGGGKMVYEDIASGESALATFSVTNTGTDEDEYDISLTALPDDWAGHVDGAGLRLIPGQSMDIVVRIETVPGHFYQVFPVYVKATSRSEATVSDHSVLFIRFTDVEWGPGGTVVNASGTVTNFTSGGGAGGGGGSGRGDEGEQGMFSFTFPTITTFHMAMVAVAVIIFLGSILIYKALRRRPRGMRAILRELKKHLYSIDTDDEFRKAVFQAYAQMCDEFKLKGRGRGDAVTPKEFEEEVGEILPVSKEKLETLTVLFEEARYSTHRFDENRKEQALGALDGILDELDRMEELGASEQGYIAVREQKLRSILGLVRTRIGLLKALSKLLATKITEEVVRLKSMRDVPERRQAIVKGKIALLRMKRERLEEQAAKLTLMEVYLSRMVGKIEKGTLTPSERKMLVGVDKELEDLEDRIGKAIKESEFIEREARKED